MSYNILHRVHWYIPIEKVLLTGKNMTEKEFWEIVGRVKKNAGNDVEIRADLLQDNLLKKTDVKIEQFQDLYYKLRSSLNRDDICRTAYALMGSLSDDSFEYFSNWIISEGEYVYKNTLKDPLILNSLNFNIKWFEWFEDYGYAAFTAYEVKFKKPMY